MKQHGMQDVKAADKHQGNTMQMKIKLYSRIILLINYIKDENLFVNVE